MLLLSALPAKIVGLELFGVLQLSFFTLGSQDSVNAMMASMLGMKGVNGLNLNLNQSAPTPGVARRMLMVNSGALATATVPSRIYSIGY